MKGIYEIRDVVNAFPISENVRQIAVNEASTQQN